MLQQSEGPSVFNPVIRRITICVLATLIFSVPVIALAQATSPLVSPTQRRLIEPGARLARHANLAPAAVSAVQLKPSEDPRSQDPARGLHRVLVTIDPDQQVKESSSRHDIVELIEVDPKFDWAENIRFQHDIWSLEFAFKPMRLIEVDVPLPSGKMRKKQLWYMVYRVVNYGDVPVPNFTPVFELASDIEDSQGRRKRYMDRIIPVANKPIAKREHFPLGLLNTVEICGEIPVSERPVTGEDGRPAGPGIINPVWGVATWEDIDPRTDRFSVFVRGLTNAYRWKDTLEGRKFTYKTLELRFWRPGDALHQHEREFRFGDPDAVDYEWVYR